MSFPSNSERMKTLKILIADDEQSARELIHYYLEQTQTPVEISQAADGNTALALLTKEKPDIFFLDIKMPGLSGIEVLKQRESAPLPAIIFTTAFDEFALPAFDFEAIDYLLKPFDKERFDKSFEKATRYINYITSAANKPWLEQLNVKKGTRTVLIPIEDIRYFQSQGAYVEAFTGDKNWLINIPLYEMETRLDPTKFLRIHRSLIIQSKFVKEINSLLNGDFIVRMECGKELRGSRTYKSRIKNGLLN